MRFLWPFKTATLQWESNYQRGSHLVNKDHISDLFSFFFLFYFADSFISRGSRGQEDRCPNCWQRQTLFQHFCLKRRDFIEDSMPLFIRQFISYINFLLYKKKGRKHKKNGSPSFLHLNRACPSLVLPRRLDFVFYLCGSIMKSYVNHHLGLGATESQQWFWWNDCRHSFVSPGAEES